jgi:PAS domain S-box-containing protein
MPLPTLSVQYPPLVEHLPVMVWRTDPAGGCDYVNATWLAWRGTTLQAELGEGWVRGVHAEDVPLCLETYRSHFERRAPFEIEYRLLRHDGLYRYVLDRGVPFVDAKGQFGGFIGACIDIHERRMADASKATFVSMIAHDLRTPLQAASNYIDVIREWLARHEPVPPHTLDRLVAQLGRITKLVRELSQVSAWEIEGNPPLAELSLCDLRSIVRDALDVHAHVLDSNPESKHRLRLEQPERPMLMYCDRERLVQAFDNVVENAIKYSPAGGEIQVVLRSDSGQHWVTVRDQGIGIPQEELLDVTRRYFRASNAVPAQFAGIGIGLALVRELVEAHGGRFAIESQLGEGTLVRLSFPEACEAQP